MVHDSNHEDNFTDIILSNETKACRIALPITSYIIQYSGLQLIALNLNSTMDIHQLTCLPKKQ